MSHTFKWEGKGVIFEFFNQVKGSELTNIKLDLYKNENFESYKSTTTKNIHDFGENFYTGIREIFFGERQMHFCTKQKPQFLYYRNLLISTGGKFFLVCQKNSKICTLSKKMVKISQIQKSLFLCGISL